MKATFYTILFFLLTLCVRGQENGLQFKQIESQYALGKQTEEQFFSFYFNLPPIQSSKFKSHVRISFSGQIIDLFSSDNVRFQGRLTNYIAEFETAKSSNPSQVHQYVFEQLDLEQSKVDKFIQGLLQSGQINAPTDSLIPSWQRNFLHCNSLAFQFNMDGKYTKQIFHCPWAQNDSVPYKHTVVRTYESLKSTFLLDSLYKSFEGKLPKGKTYSVDGAQMRFKMTDQQVEHWKKSQPQRDFMKSVKDTIDLFLNSELKKRDLKLNGIDCEIDFRLTFGTNGKLKSAEISDLDKPTLKSSVGLGDYLARKKETRKCQRKVEQVFGGIDLSFLNLESEIYRTFKFDAINGFQLRDDTIY